MLHRVHTLNTKNGSVTIPTYSVTKLAGFYKTSTDYLLELTDEITPYKAKKK